MTNEIKHTPGPWEYVPSTEHHGPYVANGWGAGDICDCYTMSNPSDLAVCNGGTSRPIHFQHEEADANARLIAAAPDLLTALKSAMWMIGAHEGTSDENDAIVDACRAAVAKAEGRA